MNIDLMRNDIELIRLACESALSYDKMNPIQANTRTFFRKTLEYIHKMSSVSL